MIRFKAVRWRNFLSTGNAWTEIKLDTHDNTLIIGENGAGKSTLLDAICYALFGEPFRKINIPTLVNSINQSDLLVEVDFVVNNHKYQVRRGIKPAIFEIWKDDTLVNQTGAREYQAFLETQIIHMNKKVFTQVDILGNANYVPFMQLKANERRAVIEDILDIQIFSVMNELLKARQKTIKEKLVENKHNTDITETESNLKTSHIEQLQRNKAAEIAENRGKISQTSSQILAIGAEIESQRVSIEKLQEKTVTKRQVKDRHDLATSHHSQISNKLLKHGTDKSFWANTAICPTCDQAIAGSKKDEKLKEVLDLEHKCEEALVKLVDMQVKFSSQLEAIETVELEIHELSATVAQQKAQLPVLRKLLSEYEKKENELERGAEDLEKERNELTGLKKRLDSLLKERQTLVEEGAYLEVAGTILKDSGIKTLIVKQYLPIINKLVNKHLANMDFFVNFELDENFKEHIRSRYRDDFSYENFSEGEKQRIDMGLMLTWREVAKMKNSAASNLLLLDEIFDSSLDATGTEYLLQLLHALEKCNLFVISHKGDILQDKFGHVIRFAKTGNYSRIQ